MNECVRGVLDDTGCTMVLQQQCMDAEHRVLDRVGSSLGTLHGQRALQVLRLPLALLLPLCLPLPLPLPHSWAYPCP